MVILKVVFKQTFAYFGAAEVIMAMLIVWGFTQLITSQLSPKRRWAGLLVMILAILLAVGIGLVGYRESAEIKG